MELASRTGKSDFTKRFDAIARALPRAVRTPDFVLDGEVCAIDDTGRASFSAMQQGAGTLVYYVFDLLEQDGEPLVDLPLTERRRRLKKLLGRSSSVAFTDTFDDGDALLEAAAQQSLEGVMAKRPDSRYEQGRSRQWLKVKVRPRQELVVAGYTKGQRRRERMGALVLAVNEQSGLRWAGNVGTGFTEDEIDDLLARLKPLERRDSPLAAVPKMPRVRKAISGGSSPSSSSRSSSSNGRTKATCVFRPSSGYERTSCPRMSAARSRSPARSRRASGL